MGQVKRYDELSGSERILADQILFQKVDPNSPLGQTERESFLFGEFSPFERNHYFFCDEEIVASLSIVSVEVPVKGEAFITEVYCDDGMESAFEELLEYGLEICRALGAKKVFLGTKPKYNFLKSVILASGLVEAYRLLVLKKEDNQLYHQANHLVPLVEETCLDYSYIMTRSFLNSPNGASVSEEEAHELLGKEVIVGLFRVDDINVGAFELRNENGIGWIDSIAILPEFQGRGYGKRMLEEVCDLLVKSGAKILKMLVAESNETALNLYLDHAFIEEDVLSQWYKYQYKENL